MNQESPNKINQPQKMPTSAPTPQSPAPGSADDNAKAKAWKKLKAGAILLVIGSVLGLVLTPLAMNAYGQDEAGQRLGLIFGIINGLYSLVLLFIGIKLLNRDWAFRNLIPVGKRLTITLVIAISMLFVIQLSKYINLVSVVLIIFALNSLRKAGVIQR